MADLVFELFDEFAVRHARGEHPDPVEYLDRAGVEESELARLFDLFLQWAPPPTPDESAVKMMEAWLAGEPPLVTLRVERGIRVDDLVEKVGEELRVDVSKRSKLRRYLQRLEFGTLDVADVDQRVLDVLASLLRSSRSTLAVWASPPRRGDSAALAPAFRTDGETVSPPVAPTVPQGEWDEVDKLFLRPPAA